MGERTKEISLGWLILICDSSTVVESVYQFEQSGLTSHSSHSLAFPRLLKEVVLDTNLLCPSQDSQVSILNLLQCGPTYLASKISEKCPECDRC